MRSILPDLILVVFEGLHAFETLNCIMECTVERVNLQLVEGFDLRNAPVIVLVVDFQHVVRVLHSEGQLLEIRQQRLFFYPAYYYISRVKSTSSSLAERLLQILVKTAKTIVKLAFVFMHYFL
jgi:hypothetical protein